MSDLRLLTSENDLVVKGRDELGVRVISLSGEADLGTEHRLARALRDVLPQGEPALVLDLGGLKFCSAHAMGVLVDIVSSTAHRGVTVGLVGLPAICARVWLLTDVPIPVQFARVDLAVAALSRPTRTTLQPPEPGTVRLLAELDGLRRALATRAVIEQAKGMLMERLSCTSQEAFDLLVKQSQRSARRVNDVAAEFLQPEVAAARREQSVVRDPEPAA